MKEVTKKELSSLEHNTRINALRAKVLNNFEQYMAVGSFPEKVIMEVNKLVIRENPDDRYGGNHTDADDPIILTPQFVDFPN